MILLHMQTRGFRFKELQQISNRAASSRDIAVRLTLLEDIRLMCGGTMTDASRYMYTILYSKIEEFNCM